MSPLGGGGGGRVGVGILYDGAGRQDVERGLCTTTVDTVVFGAGHVAHHENN